MSITSTDRERELATRAVALARQRGWRLATAESCSAGLIAWLLSQVEGAGSCFHGGIVAYSKQMKREALAVPGELPAAKTAVCEAVACAMAEGAVSLTPADAALAITGVAGPDPDEDGNPVGLVYVAVATPEGTAVKRLDLGRSPPDQILREAICAALDLFLERAERSWTSFPSDEATHERA